MNSNRPFFVLIPCEELFRCPDCGGPLVKRFRGSWCNNPVCPVIYVKYTSRKSAVLSRVTRAAVGLRMEVEE